MDERARVALVIAVDTKAPDPVRQWPGLTQPSCVHPMWGRPSFADVPRTYSLPRTSNATPWSSAVSDVLKRDAGFTAVEVLPNPDRKLLLKGLSKFQALVASLKAATPTSGVEGGCLALIYFVGPIATSNSEQYILPADWQSEVDDLGWALQVNACKLSYMLESLSDAYAGIVLVEEAAPVNKVGQHGSRYHKDIEDQGQPLTTGRPNLLVLQAQQPNTTSSGPPDPVLLKKLCSKDYESVFAAAEHIEKRYDVGGPVKLHPGNKGLFQSIHLASGGRSAGEKAIHLATLLFAVCNPRSDLQQRCNSARQLLLELQGATPGAAARMSTLVDLGCIPLLMAVLQETRSVGVPLQSVVCTVFQKLAVDPANCDLMSLEGVAPLLLNTALGRSEGPVTAAADAWQALLRLVRSKGAKMSLLAHNTVPRLIGLLYTSFTEFAASDTLVLPAQVETAANSMKLLATLLTQDYYGGEQAIRQANATGQLREILAIVKQAKVMHKLITTHEGQLLLRGANEVNQALEGCINNQRTDLYAYMLVPTGYLVFFAIQMIVCIVVLSYCLLLWLTTGNSCRYIPLMLLVLGFLVPDPCTRLSKRAARQHNQAQTLPTLEEVYYMERMSVLPGAMGGHETDTGRATTSAHSRGGCTDLEEPLLPSPFLQSLLTQSSSGRAIDIGTTSRQETQGHSGCLPATYSEGTIAASLRQHMMEEYNSWSK